MDFSFKYSEKKFSDFSLKIVDQVKNINSENFGLIILKLENKFQISALVLPDLVSQGEALKCDIEQNFRIPIRDENNYPCIATLRIEKFEFKTDKNKILYSSLIYINSYIL